MNTNEFITFFRDAPPAIDVDTIRVNWETLSPFYTVDNWLLPLPPWLHKPYQDPGKGAWTALCQDLAESPIDKPFCIYMHAPFCSSKCGFCDNYSFKLGSHQATHVKNYVERLCCEMQLWGEQGNLSQRPVSTVHLGGGTPTFLGETALTRLAECCRDHFSISQDTEWALESTVQSLTPSMIKTMHSLGYRRLHIGVQSMEDSVRRTIGRRTPAAQVQQVVETTLSLGWVVSVDLICGLPGQTLTGFLDGIETLIKMGVNGFSLYELLVFPQNIRWCAQHGLTDPRRHLKNYWMFAAGASLLASHGFRKNLFNHWADERDANIYFTFPTRDEDLLAIGTIADGVFGDYHYRHGRYADYMKTACGGLPGLEGGLRRDSAFNRLRPLTTAIQSGHIPAGLVDELAVHRTSDGLPLLARWMTCNMVVESGDGGVDLTSSGSWFTGNLIAELYQ